MTKHPFDLRKKIVIYGFIIKETPKFIQFRVKEITQFSQDSPSGEKIVLHTDFIHRLSKNWIYSNKVTGTRKEQASRYPPRVISFKYHYHSKIIPKFMQKHQTQQRR